MPAVCAMGCAVAGLAVAASSEMKNPPALERPTPERAETLVDALDDALVHMTDIAPVGVSAGGIRAVQKRLPQQQFDVELLILKFERRGIGWIPQPGAPGRSDARK